MLDICCSVLLLLFTWGILFLSPNASVHYKYLRDVRITRNPNNMSTPPVDDGLYPVNSRLHFRTQVSPGMLLTNPLYIASWWSDIRLQSIEKQTVLCPDAPYFSSSIFQLSIKFQVYSTEANIDCVRALKNSYLLCKCTWANSNNTAIFIMIVSEYWMSHFDLLNEYICVSPISTQFQRHDRKMKGGNNSQLHYGIFL